MSVHGFKQHCCYMMHVCIVSGKQLYCVVGIKSSNRDPYIRRRQHWVASFRMLPALTVDTQCDWTSSTLSGHLTQCAPETGEGTWGWSRVEVPQQLTLMNASIQSASKPICQIRVDTNQNVGPQGIQAAFGSVARIRIW